MNETPGRRITLIYDDKHWLHQDPRGEHPENPYRLEICLETLRNMGFSNYMDLRGIMEPDVEVLTKIHTVNYIEFIKRESSRGFHYLDSDTYVNENSFNVAAGFTTACVKNAYEAFDNNGVVLAMVRPPGHHAGSQGRAFNAPTLGFCLFNHAAAVASALLSRTNYVFIIDFDAHHGNGTQEIFWNEPRVIHIDIHQHGIYPGTGWVNETGGKGAEGSKINVPLQPGAGDGEFVWVLNNIVKPMIEQYKPGVIVVSAGFDSYRNDGLADLQASSITFSHYGRYLYEVLKNNMVKTVIVVLEGGYSIGLKHGLRSFVEALITGKQVESQIHVKPPPQRVYQSLRKIMLEHHGIRVVD